MKLSDFLPSTKHAHCLCVFQCSLLCGQSARRFSVRANLAGVLVASAVFFPAQAEIHIGPFQSQTATSITWAGGRSYIDLRPTTQPGAVAEIEFMNDFVHQDAVEEYTLTLDDLTYLLRVDVGKGDRPDFLRIEAPEGFVAVPHVLEVPERASGITYIYPLGRLGV